MSSNVGFLQTPSCEAPDKPLVSGEFHTFYASIVQSFDDHVPMILYPDALWVQILQQLAIHVHENAESLRKKWSTLTAKSCSR